jgi:hypothetical protein
MIGKIVNWLLRIAAAITAAAMVPLLFFVGIMADDAGTPVGLTVGLLIIASSIAFLGFVLWASFAHWPSRSPQTGRYRVRSLVPIAVVYLVGISGLMLGTKWLLPSQNQTSLQSPEVLAQEPVYPKPNASPK